MSQTHNPADPANYGHVDKNTPIGRFFEFGDGYGDLPNPPARPALAYQGTNQYGAFTFDVLGEQICIAPDIWARDYAPRCTGYVDSDETPGGQIAFAGHPARADGMEALALARDELARASSEHELAAEVAKAKKKRMEEAQAALNHAVDELLGAKPTDLPLFTGRPGPGAAGAERPEAEAWRSVELATLADPAIPPRYLKALVANGPKAIVTLGDLTDWQADKGDFWAKDIHGLGPAGQEKIAAACDAYWQREGGVAPRSASSAPKSEGE